MDGNLTNQLKHTNIVQLRLADSVYRQKFIKLK